MTTAADSAAKHLFTYFFPEFKVFFTRDRRYVPTPVKKFQNSIHFRQGGYPACFGVERIPNPAQIARHLCRVTVLVVVVHVYFRILIRSFRRCQSSIHRGKIYILHTVTSFCKLFNGTQLNSTLFADHITFALKT